MLYVDDDVALGVAVQRALRREHDVLHAKTIAEGMNLIGATATFDLVLCDLMLANETGRDFHVAVEMHRPDLLERIVYVTGGAYTAESQAFLESVPNARIEKPLDIKLVCRLVAERLANAPRP